MVGAKAVRGFTASTTCPRGNLAAPGQQPDGARLDAVFAVGLARAAVVGAGEDHLVFPGKARTRPQRGQQ